MFNWWLITHWSNDSSFSHFTPSRFVVLEIVAFPYTSLIAREKKSRKREMVRDYKLYQQLGVSTDAMPNDLKKAYKMLALKRMGFNFFS